MWRIRSVVPWRVRLLLAVLMLGAWRAEGLLIEFVAGGRVGAWVRGAVGTVAGRDPLASAGAFIDDGIAGLAGTLAQLYGLLPAAVRDTLPGNALAPIGHGFATLFGWRSGAAFVAAMLVLGAELVRLLLALNVAGWTYNGLRRTGRQVMRVFMLPVRFYGDREPADDAPPAQAASPVAGRVGGNRRREYVEFFGGHITNIGIILPGGGARGAYQAGALKAVYDFLREYHALAKVRVIVATATGAWNAMFWMAGLMEEGRGAPHLASWWKQQGFTGLMEFRRFWLPLLSDHCFSNAPWREQFAELFAERVDHLFGEAPELHFYFTRADMRLGALRYATNWSGLKQRVQTLGLENQDNYRLADVIGADGHQAERLADALFGSLGQAPLFPGVCDGVLCESGDAIDPVPLRFAAPVEDCDLVFVLPSQGAPERLDDSRVGRMRRLVHVQQTALERIAVKQADSINRIAERFERLEFGTTTIAAAAGVVGVAAEAASGVREELDEFSHAYKRLYIFTACPAGDLAMGTLDYGHGNAAAAAFDLMYAQTQAELQHRLFEDIEPEDAHVVMVDGLVSAKGEPVKPTYRRPSQL